MKQFRKFYTSLFLLSIIGCEDFVSVDKPKNQLVSSAVFSSDEQASAALTGIYTDMYQRNWDAYRIPFCTGLASDELRNYSNVGEVQQLYQNALQAVDAITNAFWINGYSFIYQANAVMEGCAGSTAINAAVKKQLLAEARFIRAFWYFYLVNFYGDVPLVTQSDYKANAEISRAAASEVYDQIITDLKYAVENLSEGYMDATGVNTSLERVRPNRSAAQALLARTYLYTENWAAAATTASEVIDYTALYDTVSVNQVFLKNNREAIWQIPNTSVNDQSTYEARGFILQEGPLGITTTNCTTISPQLKAAFEMSDLRWNHWVGAVTDSSLLPEITYYFPYKYKDQRENDPAEYSTVLRLAEQYLIRAEARARLGEFTGALVDLNLLRRRAGLEELVLNAEEPLLDAILRERQIELFAEWGHRWFDLKRTGRINEVMQEVASQNGGISWTEAKQWWPVPQQEIESNPNLIQNPSYD